MWKLVRLPCTGVKKLDHLQDYEEAEAEELLTAEQRLVNGDLPTLELPFHTPLPRFTPCRTFSHTSKRNTATNSPGPPPPPCSALGQPECNPSKGAPCPGRVLHPSPPHGHWESESLGGGVSTPGSTDGFLLSLLPQSQHNGGITLLQVPWTQNSPGGCCPSETYRLAR